MKRLNRRGYMTIEVILASVMTFIIAFFLIDLTMKLIDNTDNAYADTALTTDKVLVTKNVKANIEKDMCDNGGIKKVTCTSNTCVITMNNNVNRYLSINDSVVQYTDGSNTIYSKEVHSSLTNISLTSSNGNNYYCFKISGENVFIDESYDMNIFVYNRTSC